MNQKKSAATPAAPADTIHFPNWCPPCHGGPAFTNEQLAAIPNACVGGCTSIRNAWYSRNPGQFDDLGDYADGCSRCSNLLCWVCGEHPVEGACEQCSACEERDDYY